MNSEQSVDVPLQPLMRHLTMHVRVTGATRWKIRQWLGIRLLKLSAYVMGCNIEVNL